MRGRRIVGSPRLAAAAMLALAAGMDVVALGAASSEPSQPDCKPTRRAEKDAAALAKAQRKRERKAAKRAALLKKGGA